MTTEIGLLNKALSEKINELKELIGNDEGSLPSVESPISVLKHVETRLVYHTNAPIENNYAELERRTGRDKRGSTPSTAGRVPSEAESLGRVRYY